MLEDQLKTTLPQGSNEQNQAQQEKVESIQKTQQDETVFLARYLKMYKDLDLENNVLARFRTFHNLKGTFWPGLKRLSVSKGWKAIVYNMQGGLETELSDGIYTASHTTLSADPLAAFLDSFRGTHLCIFMCRSQDFPLTFMVPEMEGPYEDLSNCNIRSSEGFVGGAYLTTVMRIEDPARLLTTLGNLGTREHPGVDEQGLWRRFMDSLFAKSKEEDTTNNFTAKDLWESIRSEFVMTIGSAIANESLDQMRNSLEVRNRVLDAIGTSMSGTLERFGVKLAQVTSFRFLSPGHDMVLQRKAELAEKVAGLEAKAHEARLEAQGRDIEEGTEIDKLDTQRNLQKARLTTQGDVQRIELTEAETTELRRLQMLGTTASAADRNRTEELERRKLMHASYLQHLREQDALKQNHEREQKDEGFKLDMTHDKAKLDLGYEKTKKYLELKKLQDDALLDQKLRVMSAQNANRIAYAQAIAAAQLPSDSILALQLADHPELADAYAKAVQAKSFEDRLQLQKEFEGKLTAINTTDRAQVHALLAAGINQIGNVMSEAQKKQRAQLVVTGTKAYEVTVDPPPGGPGAGA